MRLHFAELAGLDQGSDDRPMLSATVGTCEESVLSIECDRPGGNALIRPSILVMAEMNHFQGFLFNLGNLHDCILTKFHWDIIEHRVELEIEDIYFNFARLPEYDGPLSGRITLEGLKSISVQIDDPEGPLKIYDFACEEIGSNTSTALITFSPHGRISINYQRAIFPNIALRRS